MEEFTRVDIFDTKGVEYIFVIFYLIVLIVFWNVIKPPKRVLVRVKEAIKTVTVGILRIPQGLFFNRNHTWTHMDPSGVATVGVDDFIQHVTGELEHIKLSDPGENLQKGKSLAEIGLDGRRLNLRSPISGEVVEVNPMLTDHPELLNEDPYELGWIYRVKPSNWKGETKAYLMAEKATEWSKRELERFRDFLSMEGMKDHLPAESDVVLQDGGEIRSNILADMPEQVWEMFQTEFLDTD